MHKILALRMRVEQNRILEEERPGPIGTCILRKGGREVQSRGEGKSERG